MPILRRSLLVLLLMALSLAGLSGCSTGSWRDSSHGVDLAPLDSMPAYVKDAPKTVQQAYQFAVANPRLLEEIPCYCGCGAMGHASNYACYVSARDSAGEVVYDTHATGCSICVDITQDTMRLLKDGKSPHEIRAYIDSTYAKFGPSNIP